MILNNSNVRYIFERVCYVRCNISNLVYILHVIQNDGRFKWYTSLFCFCIHYSLNTILCHKTWIRFNFHFDLYIRFIPIRSVIFFSVTITLPSSFFLRLLYLSYCSFKWQSVLINLKDHLYHSFNESKNYI